MEVKGWLLDKSAAARIGQPEIATSLGELAGQLWICPVGRLEQLYSARSATDYDLLAEQLSRGLHQAEAPADLLDRSEALQRDLAHHHGMWHRVAIPDLMITETALYNDLGVVHVDGDYERIAEVRPLTQRRLAS